jgi:hypothetical protein
MSRALQILRGMLGTGVAFAIGGGALLASIGTALSLFGGPPMRAVLATAARGSVLGFLLGVAFSGLLALLARGRTFEKLSLKAFVALGAGVGIVAWVLMGVNGAFHAWSLDTAILNFVLLTLMGGGSAAAVLWLARRAQGAPGDAERAESPPR